VLVLLHQHRPNQAGDRGIIREDADDAGAALNEPICLAHLSEVVWLFWTAPIVNL
jgi:hypothetical protein